MGGRGASRDVRLRSGSRRHRLGLAPPSTCVRAATKLGSSGPGAATEPGEDAPYQATPRGAELCKVARLTLSNERARWCGLSRRHWTVPRRAGAA